MRPLLILSAVLCQHYTGVVHSRHTESIVDSLLNSSSINNNTESTNFNLSQISTTVDIVDRFLLELETYNANNCKPGTASQLGPGVVQQYGKRRFRGQAQLAVNRANLLTEIWKLDNSQLHMDELFYFGQVLNLVQSDPDIFAAGNCYDKKEFKDYELFCPYAYRTNNSVLVKDLSVEYPYLGYEWFMDVRASANRLLPHRNLTLTMKKVRLQMLNGTSYHGEVSKDNTILMNYEDGHWSTPYFDCGGGNIWMMTYTVPFFGIKNGTYKFKGTSGIDIALQKVDIDQCNLPPDSPETNVFANSSKCQPETTECIAVRNMGFRRGSYKCVCRDGYYFPNLELPLEERYFNGSYTEQQFDLYLRGKENSYDEMQCLPCKEGCDVCEDDRPCVLELNWILRNCLLAANLMVMCVIPAIAYLVWKYQEHNVIKAASPILLHWILGGAFFLYCPMVVMYFQASVLTCSLKIWFRELGFTISYGALLLKTYRISAVFKVSTATQVKITDSDLIKRLAILISITVTFLVARMVWGRPYVVEGRHKDDLKVYQCSIDAWDYSQAAAELVLLVWGIKLSIEVRKAPSEFNESQFISWAIYNETLLSIFINFTLFLLQYIGFSSPDILYLIYYIYITLTTTVMLIFLFTTKAYLMYQEQKKPAASRRGSTRRSGNSQFKHTSKSAVNGDVGSHNTARDEELKRVYEELGQLKQQLVKENNPHLMENGNHQTSAKCNGLSPSPPTNDSTPISDVADAAPEDALLPDNSVKSADHATAINQIHINKISSPPRQRVQLCLNDMNNVTAV